MYKFCKYCNQNKPTCEFQKRKSMKDGLNSRCKTCLKDFKKRYKDKKRLLNKKYREENKEKLKIKDKIYREKNKDKIKDYQKEYRLNNKVRLKEYYKNYKKPKESIKKISKWMSDYYIKNKNYIKSRSKKYRDANRSKYNSYQSKRRSLKIKATPNWYEKNKIEVLYDKCKWLKSITGIDYVVDHVIPLKNKHVCGLHVWANLQILERSLNAKKSNKFSWR